MIRKTIFSVVAMALMVGVSAGVAAQTATSLGTVSLVRGVMADGKALPSGSYTLRVSTAPVVSVVGQAEANAKWVEFVQGGEVKGRELASVVPADEVAHVVKGTAPASGRSKVELLRGGGYLRVWANQAGNHYLVHLVVN